MPLPEIPQKLTLVIKSSLSLQCVKRFGFAFFH